MIKKIIIFSFLFLANLSYAKKLAKPPQEGAKILIVNLSEGLKSSSPTVRMSSFIELYKLSLQQENLEKMHEAGVYVALNYFKRSNFRRSFLLLAEQLQNKIADFYTIKN